MAVTSQLVFLAVCVLGVVGTAALHTRTADEIDAEYDTHTVEVGDAYTGGNDAHSETQNEQDDEAHTEEENIGHTKTPQTEKEKLKELLKTQQEALEKLGCRPVTTRVSVMSMLDVKNSLRDKKLNPKVIAVDLCQGNNNFCGNARKGNIDGKCQPDAKGNVLREVAVYFVSNGDKQYRLLEVVEHTSCSCVCG